MSDLILRQDAISALKALEESAPTAQHVSAIFDCEDTIRALPSAESVRTAKVEQQGICWEDIRHYKEGMCASCGRNVYDHAKYCDECGARLDWSEE